MSVQVHKTEITLSPPEAARLFRNLAEAIESNNDRLLEEYSIAFVDSHKLSLGLSKWPSGTIHLKVKTTGEDAPAEKEKAAKGKDSAKKTNKEYKALKKRMKDTFKAIGKSLNAEELPSAVKVSAFLGDSSLMTFFPGHGEEHYAAYNEACAEFDRAMTAADLSAVREAFNHLAGLKDACHARYR